MQKKPILIALYFFSQRIILSHDLKQSHDFFANHLGIYFVNEKIICSLHLKRFLIKIGIKIAKLNATAFFLVIFRERGIFN